MKKVLVLEDESSIRSFVVINLKRSGYEPIEAETGEQALEELKKNPDIRVALLDVMLPDIDGFEVCRRIRASGSKIGIIMLTAKSQEMDKVTGLMTGADDYVTKPFSMEEVLLRLHRIVQRAGVTAPNSAHLTVGDLTLDRDTRQVSRAGTEMTLTSTEFKLLQFLMENPRHVLSKTRILDRVWDYDFGGQSNIVELYISYLRKKIDADREPMIHTIRGAGYVIKPCV